MLYKNTADGLKVQINFAFADRHKGGICSLFNQKKPTYARDIKPPVWSKMMQARLMHY